MRITSVKKPKMVDEWVETALTDDVMLVELLLRLKHAGTVKSDNQAVNLPELRWGIRQRRSRPSRLGGVVNVGGVGGYLKKETDSARASPMTPLCWSGGSTSPSTATADGFEDTSRLASCSTSGSKAINEFTSSCFWRSKKKKKTSFELKDAEHLHLKERLDLEKIANVQATYFERNAKNQSLKRIKHAYADRGKTDLISSKSNLEESRKRRHLPIKNEEKGFFFLPDLNMAAPTDEDETLYGTS
ncbi:PREDICTED: uncharacterized protein LOC104703053 isoform X2 [Camelina sativa]|uniref:Uncharacterized protein LOC104703053 isoform X2 n=1 Tax=Camelina sativa TaxID=90675 RepID=A0ABM0SWV5_CAMSA|nr:PREDICTED: uncharacterized protein LOC104703053 isoform X2 [Camelina sativa]